MHDCICSPFFFDASQIKRNVQKEFERESLFMMIFIHQKALFFCITNNLLYIFLLGSGCMKLNEICSCLFCLIFGLWLTFTIFFSSWIGNTSILHLFFSYTFFLALFFIFIILYIQKRTTFLIVKHLRLSFPLFVY